MTNRVYISPTLVSISKPGFDVLSPSGVSYDYLSLDSRLGQFRPLLIGQASNVVIGSTKVLFGTTFAQVPYVYAMPYAFGTISGETIASATEYLATRETGGSHISRNVFYVYPQPDGFYMVDDFVADRPYNSFALVLYYVWEHVP